MLKQEEREITGYRVVVTQFMAMRALGLVDKALAFGAGELKGAELQDFARQMLAGTTIARDKSTYELGKDDHINAAFEGDWSGLLQVLAFAIEVNYASFSNGPAASAAGPKAKGGSRSTSTTTSPSSGQPTD